MKVKQDAPPLPVLDDDSEDLLIPNRVLRIDELQPHPRNYQEHPDSQLAKLQASLVRFSQVRSIVVQEGAPGMPFLIVAGHGLIEAARAKGFKRIKADIIPANWTPEQVEGYMLADNLTQRESYALEDLLAELLQEQQRAGYDLMTLGSDEAELNDLLAKMERPDLDDLEDKFGSPDSEEFWPFVRLQVPPEVKERFDSLMDQAPGSTDAVKFARILDVVDTSQWSNLEDDEEEDDGDLPPPPKKRRK